jgi:hypothetical protein
MNDLMSRKKWDRPCRATSLLYLVGYLLRFYRTVSREGGGRGQEESRVLTVR